MLDSILLKTRAKIALRRNVLNIVSSIFILLSLLPLFLMNRVTILRIDYDAIIIVYLLMIYMSIYYSGYRQRARVVPLIRAEDLSIIIFDTNPEHVIMRTLLLSLIIESIVNSVLPLGLIIMVIVLMGSILPAISAFLIILTLLVIAGLRRCIQRTYIVLMSFLTMLYVSSLIVDIIVAATHKSLGVLEFLMYIASPLTNNVISVVSNTLIIFACIVVILRLFKHIESMKISEVFERIFVQVSHIETVFKIAGTALSSVIDNVSRAVFDAKRVVSYSLVPVVGFYALGIMETLFKIPLKSVSIMYYMMLFFYVIFFDTDIKRLSLHLSYITAMLSYHPVTFKDIYLLALRRILRSIVSTSIPIFAVAGALYSTLFRSSVGLLLLLCPFIALCCLVPMVPLYVALILPHITAGQTVPTPSWEQIESEVLSNITRGISRYRILLGMLLIFNFFLISAIVALFTLYVRLGKVIVLPLAISLAIYVAITATLYRYAMRRLP